MGLRSARGPVLLAVMLSTALVALDQTIVATAVPAIVRDLGGFREFPWLFSVYLLTQAATVPVNGKLADLFGRKPVMYYGIAVFLARVGAVRPLVEHAGPDRGARPAGPGRWRRAADGDDDHRRPLHAPRAREGAGLRGQRVGDLVGDRSHAGGAFSQLWSWRLIFWVNVPLCLVAAWLLRRFTERVERHPV